MQQAKLNEERQQIEKELALSQRVRLLNKGQINLERIQAAEEEANRLANENLTSKPISEKHISTVRRMIEKKVGFCKLNFFKENHHTSLLLGKP